MQAALSVLVAAATRSSPLPVRCQVRLGESKRCGGTLDADELKRNKLMVSLLCGRA